jgi:hypothetical protein
MRFLRALEMIEVARSREGERHDRITEVSDRALRRQGKAHAACWPPAADAVGQVTAVDGATLLDMDLGLLAFGAMIRSSPSSIGDVLCVEAGRAKAGGVTRSIGELGGARHRAAAKFCCRIQESVAFVASQDGVLTELGWLKTEGRLVALLHAERYLP